MTTRVRLLAALTTVGFVIPNVMVVVFFAEHGVDLTRYLDNWFGTLPATALVGLCFAIPLYLLLRERRSLALLANPVDDRP